MGMSIELLPQSTARLIGASLVLTDSAAIVKELIDNALDARATSVFVEISANTIDVVQVRDNGYGICSQDRPLVCKRHCTSKLRSYADLKVVGQNFLGFRGEALAAAAELCGSTTVTTRADGEEVASTLKINPHGNIESELRSSHPTGTTVRLANLFKDLPVRKQMALKTATKCLTKVQRYLKAYALARLNVRLSLKILNSNSVYHDWTYVPKADSADIKDALCKIVGRACATECEEHTAHGDGFHIQAFLPKECSDLSKTNGNGQFISIDLRPVSASRGVPRQIVNMLKKHLGRLRMQENPDPFIWMNITCPSGTYDPNIESSKDEVLFADSTILTGLVKTLFENIYGAVEQETSNKYEKTIGSETVVVHSIPSDPQIQGYKSQSSALMTLPTVGLGYIEHADQHCKERTKERKPLGSDLNPWTIANMRSRKTLSQQDPLLATPPFGFTQSNVFETVQLPTPLSLPSPLENLRQNNISNATAACGTFKQKTPRRRVKLSEKPQIGGTHGVRHSDSMLEGSPFTFTAFNIPATAPCSKLKQSRIPATSYQEIDSGKISGFPLTPMSQEHQLFDHPRDILFEHVPRRWEVHNIVSLNNFTVDLGEFEKYLQSLGPNCIGTATDRNFLPSLTHPKPTMQELNMWEARTNEYLASIP